MNAILEFLEGDTTLSLNSDKPWIFCLDGWAEEMCKGEDGLTTWWWPDLKEETVRKHPYCATEVAGATIIGEAAGNWNSILSADAAGIWFCSSALATSTAGRTLGSTSADGRSLIDLLFPSASMFHELFHLVHGNTETPDTSCIVTLLEC